MLKALVNKKYFRGINMYLYILIISCLISIPKWIFQFQILHEDIYIKTILDFQDSLYFPLIKTFSELNLNPSYNEVGDLKLLSYPFFGLIINSIFYKFFGMSYFDSITHSMTTIATGGFSNYNESIGYFESGTIEMTSMLFIILGSVPFIAYIKFINGDKKIFLQDTQIKTFIKIIFFSIVILYFYLSILNKNSVEIELRSVSFNVISILTGTGYVTKDFDSWGSFPLMFFLLLMFILSKFAWKPLLKMLNEREEKIRTAIEKAENAEKKLETLNEQGEKILSDARSESQKLLLSTKETAQNLKEEIEREAKQKATSIIDQARVQIQAEKNQVLSEIKNELSSFSIMIAEKLIKKNINKDDNMKLINESIEKVNKINGNVWGIIFTKK